MPGMQTKQFSKLTSHYISFRKFILIDFLYNKLLQVTALK